MSMTCRRAGRVARVARVARVCLPVAAAALLVGAPGAGAATADCAAPHWVTAFAFSPSDATAATPLAASTLRIKVYPHLAGTAVRVHLTNRYGSGPVVVGAATVGVQQSGAALVCGRCASGAVRG